MKKLNKLIITEMLLDEVLCTVCAVIRDQKVVELRLEPSGKKNTLNNIYVGQVENIAANIQAAFVRLSDSVKGYLPLNQCTNAIYADGRKSDQPLRPGDQLLVQINREAMKGKLPALTANLNFSGKYLVLTTGNRKIGFSNKLSKEESSLLNKWLEEERNLPDRPYGLIARTNAAEATKEEFLHELEFLKKQYQKTAIHGRNRTCYRADEGSGVAAIYVNGNEFTELTNGALQVRLQKADTTYQYFTLQVRDNAGNISENYKVANPYYEDPEAVKETPSGTGEEQKNNSLPADANATPPTSAKADVTEHQTTGNTSAEPTEPENVDTDIGRVQEVPSGTEKSGKEFYTIQTKSDKVFYLIIDNEKTDENVYLLTEVSENDLLNFTDSNMVTLPQNNAIQETALPLEKEENTEETEPEPTEKPEPEKEPEKKSENNSGTMLIMLLVLGAVGGGYYYLKFVKGKNGSFDADYDDEDEDDMEDEETFEEESDEEPENEEPEEDEGEYPEDEEYM